MSQSDSRSFGIKPQHHAGNPLPFSPTTSGENLQSRETLSDVADRCVSRRRTDAQNGCFVSPQPEAAADSDPQRSGLSELRKPKPAAESDAKCQHFSEVFSQTGDPSNTPVPSSHQVLETGGIDTLEASLYGLWSPSIWNGLKPQLDEARKRAESSDGAIFIITKEGDQLKVSPTGVRKGVYCRWMFEWNGCKIAIVANPAPSKTRLSIHVTIGSIRLMEVGHAHAWESVLAVLASLGYQHVREVVGRVDLCIDLPDESMDQVDEAVTGERLICRARKERLYRLRSCEGTKLETYSIGGKSQMIRIYDKAIECRNDPVKRAILRERRWGKSCDEAIRVEFQLRNKSLQRHFSVKTIAELFENLGTIAKWCTNDWFRIANKRVDRKNKNQSRAVVGAFWLRVQDAFQSWTGTALPRAPKARTLVPDLKQLKQQAVGCVSSLVAHVDDGRDFLDQWLELGREFMTRAEVAVITKRKKLAAACRVMYPADSEIPF